MPRPIFNFDNSYAGLPSQFYAAVNPTPVADPKLFYFNENLALGLGLNFEDLSREQLAAVFSGNKLSDGSQPIAMAYAGHQFGHFVSQLGDGRAILVGEILRADGQRFDLHLKGSGLTPYSRNGDGRAALGPVIREVIISEAMHALGVPTTRALAATTTGEMVFRENPLPGAILTRVATSHIRIGTFEFFAARGDLAALRILADHAIARHAPELAKRDQPYLAWLEKVIKAQAQLVASWMHLGFIHGVMNTDNMTISGETIDYGPCAFMDQYQATKVFSSIDRNGRYAYSNQPAVAQWNLTRFAETLLPLLDSDSTKAIGLAETALLKFSEFYDQFWLRGIRRKFGFLGESNEDRSLAEEFLEILEETQSDFTNSFRNLSAYIDIDRAKPNLFAVPTDRGDRWLAKWLQRIDSHSNRSKREIQKQLDNVNPAYIPRNHRIEQAIRAAVEESNFSLMTELMDVLAAPFVIQPGRESYQNLPWPNEVVSKTFCGT